MEQLAQEGGGGRYPFCLRRRLSRSRATGVIFKNRRTAQTYLGKELERNVDAALGQFEGIFNALFPRTLERLGPKGVPTSTANKGVPKADAEAQPFLHGLAKKHLFGVVVPKA